MHATKAERGAKGFSCWDRFVAMLFCQLGQAHSLREICGDLASCFGKAKYLGLRAALKRSTRSYANEHRAWQLYENVSCQLLGDAGNWISVKQYLLVCRARLFLTHNSPVPYTLTTQNQILIISFLLELEHVAAPFRGDESSLGGLSDQFLLQVSESVIADFIQGLIRHQVHGLC